MWLLQVVRPRCKVLFSFLRGVLMSLEALTEQLIQDEYFNRLAQFADQARQCCE